jgi:uncharacterized repeat protein (TIGR01451 family)
MEKFSLNFRFSIYISLIAFLGLMFLGFNETFANKIIEESTDTSKVSCRFPTYSVRNNDVSAPNKSDGKLLITNIYNATHYELIEGNNTAYDFKKAIALTSQQKEIEIKNISNPTGYKIYRVRLYNKNATCFNDQVITFEHLNFATNRDFAKLELLQGIDNSTPRLDELVTFTTVIQNKGTRAASNVEVRLISSQSLEIISFYAEKGLYTSNGNIWKIGELEGGRSIKLVIRAKVRAQGLSYVSSYISEEGEEKFSYSESQASGNQSAKRSGTSCVSVPISIKNNEVYNVVLKQYKGIKWYFKDASGNFSEINERTNSTLAVINPDSSLTVKQGGEFSFSKKVGDCNISSCCPIIVESCAGPTIIVDSVYCNSTVDSYSMLVHLENDKFNIIEKVFFAMSNLNFPVLTNYLTRINVLPLTSSSGYVTSLGNSRYKVENIPAFMPNVTLVSSDLTGKCRNVRIANAPNCTSRPVGMVDLADNIIFMKENESMPAFRVISKNKGLDILWFEDELGQKPIHKGKKFRPEKVGVYYVALRDKKADATGILKKIEMRELKAEIPGKFVGEKVCDCDNPLMVPQGDLGELSSAKAYPNPVSDVLTVDYRIPQTTTKAEIYFININGRIIMSQELVKNLHQIKVETNKWADGTYFYSLIVDGIRTLSKKIIVSHIN